MHRRTLVAAVLVALSVTGFPSASQGQAPPTCRFERAHTQVWAERNQNGVVQYYGHAILYTKDCGRFSPGDITVEFRPVAGQPSTCDPRPAIQEDEALCTTGVGTALPGTVMVVTAQGKRAGSGGGALFFSQCTIVLPSLSSSSCPFPMSGLTG